MSEGTGRLIAAALAFLATSVLIVGFFANRYQLTPGSGPVSVIRIDTLTGETEALVIDRGRVVEEVFSDEWFHVGK